MNEPFNPLQRLYTHVSATARTICYAAWITFLIAALLLLLGSVAFTLSGTGSWPTPDAWTFIAGLSLLGGTVAYHVVGGLLLLLARARLRGMSQVVGAVLGVIPRGDQVGDKVQELLQGVAGPRSQRANWLGDEPGPAFKPTLPLLALLLLAFSMLVSGGHLSGGRKKGGGEPSDYRYV